MAGTWNSSNRTKTSTLTASHNIFETKTRTCLLSRAETEKSSGLVSSPGPEPRLHQDLVQGTGTDQDWAKTYREPRLYQDLVQGTGTSFINISWMKLMAAGWTFGAMLRMVKCREESSYCSCALSQPPARWVESWRGCDTTGLQSPDWPMRLVACPCCGPITSQTWNN